MGLVFTTSLGTAYHPSNVNRDMEAITRKAGLPKLTSHMMRHTCATRLGQHGKKAELISKRLGHARPSITLDLYRHVLPHEMEEVSIPLSELLGERPRSSA